MGLQQLLVERQLQSAQFDHSLSGVADGVSGISAMPRTIEEWYDCVRARLQKFKRGKQVGRDRTPNELYAATGDPGIIQLAALLQKVQVHGPPAGLERRPLFAVPRKPLLPFSPLGYPVCRS